MVGSPEVQGSGHTTESSPFFVNFSVQTNICADQLRTRISGRIKHILKYWSMLIVITFSKKEEINSGP
jgi:hypothetical protein